jgi:hypothetical protein
MLYIRDQGNGEDEASGNALQNTLQRAKTSVILD